jgi:hypothetical protein
MSDIATTRPEVENSSQDRPARRSGNHEACAEAAKRHGVDYFIVYRLGRAGALGPSIRLGNAYFYCSCVTDAVMEQHRVRKAQRGKAAE